MQAAFLMIVSEFTSVNVERVQRHAAFLTIVSEFTSHNVEGGAGSALS